MKRFLTLMAMAVSLAMAGSVITSKRVTVVDGGGYFPVLIRLEDGKLMAVLRRGAAHIGRNGRLEIVESKDNGESWSKPRTVVDSEDDDRNPAFGQMKNGDIVLAYAVLKGYGPDGLSLPRAKRTADCVYTSRSSDGGASWTRPVCIESTKKLVVEGGLLSPYGKIVQLGDGAALMSVYYEVAEAGRRRFEVRVFRSEDNGKTWGQPVAIPGDYNETGLLVLRDGTVLAAARSGSGGHLAIASSQDGGKSWTTPRQITKDNEHPGDLIQLQDGAVLLSYGERNRPFGVRAMISRDSGKTWNDGAQFVLADDAASTDCGYPSSVQLQDKRVVTLFYQVDEAQSAPGRAKAKIIIWSPGG